MDSEASEEVFEERAAIREYDGKMDLKKAEWMARRDVARMKERGMDERPER